MKPTVADIQVQIEAAAYCVASLIRERLRVLALEGRVEQISETLAELAEAEEAASKLSRLAGRHGAL